MDGGAQVAEVLKSHNVPFVFTLCGGHISPILVESKKRGIRIIDTRHEVNAVFAADAVGRLTGVPGVAAVTAGPGVSNTITAIKNAQMAQSPLVLIGGATATLLRGRGALQDIDQLSLIRPHVKWAARPDRLPEVAPALNQAFKIASEGVPGPVFVELAVDLLYEEEIVREWTKKVTARENKNIKQKVEAAYISRHLNKVFDPHEPEIKTPTSAEPLHPWPGQVKKAADLIAKAQRPVMVLGSQTMLHPEEAAQLVAAVEKINVPVYLSGMARGLLGPNHPLQMRHKRRNALKESDLVLLSGVPCDFRLDYGAHVARTTLISVNLSMRDLKKNRKPDLGILGDPHTFLCRIADSLSADHGRRDAWHQTLSERDDGRNQEILKMGESQVDHLNPLSVCQAIEDHLSEKSLMVGDGGDFVATASYIVQPRGPYTWLDPGVFGTLGVGAGFALGAKLVKPDHDVWLLYGDGAAGFSMLEFDTFARHNLGVIAVVGNDAGWTQIAREQTEILKDDVATTLTYMDYHRVAEGCGGHGIQIKEAKNLQEGFEDALKRSRQGQPVCINALIGKTDFRKGSISM